MPPPELMDHIAAFSDQYKYLLIFLATIFQGPVVMMVSGFMLHLGLVDFFTVCIVLILGDLTADVVWYIVGRSFAAPLIRNYGYLFSITPELFERTEGLFQKYHAKILIISKLTMGLGAAIVVLLAAGATRVPFRIYILINSICEIPFMLLLFGIGYFFGYLYNYVAGGLKIAFLLLIAIAIFMLLRGLAKFIWQKALKT